MVWRHEGGVRGMLPCTVWRPVPPPSFVAVGCIITLTHNKPSPGPHHHYPLVCARVWVLCGVPTELTVSCQPDCVVCLHESLVVPAEVDALLWTASASPASAAATNSTHASPQRAELTVSPFDIRPIVNWSRERQNVDQSKERARRDRSHHSHVPVRRCRRGLWYNHNDAIAPFMSPLYIVRLMVGLEH